MLDPLPIARRVVLEEMGGLVVLVDEKGEIGVINEKTRETFGSERELVGRQVTTVLGDDVSLDDEEESLTLTTTVDGDRRQFRVNRSPLTDYRGTVLGQLLVCRDVTERRQHERRLRRQNERLDQFASMVSHDLRNPLTIAQGRAELTEETGDDEHFEALHDAHDRMETMIDDLLTMARADAIEETEQADLRTLVESAWDTVRTGSADIEVSIPPGQMLECDPDLLRNVFENLFRNAVEYGYTENSEGTGFGLAIVRDIVQAHGWTIVATEGTDSGARFKIELDGEPSQRINHHGPDL